jgi:hypothetical protein
MISVFSSSKSARKIEWLHDLDSFPIPALLPASIPCAIKLYDEQLIQPPQGKLASFPCDILEWRSVPPVITICCSRIQNDGLVKGIFRKSGVAHIRSTIKDQANQGILREVDDVHVASNVIKYFIRSLATPLIPVDLYPAYQRRIKSVGITQFAVELVRGLPRILRATLREIFLVCAMVVKSESETCMGLEVS